MVKGKKVKPTDVEPAEEEPVYNLYQMVNGEIYLGRFEVYSDGKISIKDINGKDVLLYERHIVARIDNVTPEDLKRSINAN